MKARHIQIIFIVASVFASFVICLTVSLADITPFILVVTLCVCALRAVLYGAVSCDYTDIKLFTQKAE